MRMFFEPSDEEGFEAESALVVNRAAHRGRTVEPDDVAAALEYRHRGTVDGRLGLWRQRHVEEFLLHWLPRSRIELAGGAAADPPTALRAFLECIEEAGLADPRGDLLPQLDSAVREAGASFRSAMDVPGPSLLLLLDTSGQDGFVETARTQGIAQVREAIARARTSAHCDREGLARLQALAEGPLSRGAAARRARAKRTGRRRNR